MLFSLCFCLTITTGQITSKKQWPIKLSILDENLTTPDLNVARYSFNPAIILGTEYYLKQTDRNEWFLGGNVGFYSHKYFRNAIFLNTELGYRHHFGRFNTSAQLGLGYAHVFATLPTYKYENGDYNEVTDWGSPAFMPSLGLELGYRLGNSPNSPELFIDYMFAVDDPFAVLPLPHQFFGLGIKFFKL